MIVYDISTGDILAEMPDEADPVRVYKNHPVIQSRQFGTLYADVPISRLREYYVKDGRLVRRSENEQEEYRRYGKILTEGERLLNQLIPSHEDITKAKNTIEMINLIQEVMI